MHMAQFSGVTILCEVSSSEENTLENSYFVE